MKKFSRSLNLITIIVFFAVINAKSQNIFYDGFETGNTNGSAVAGWTQEAVSGTNTWIANAYADTVYMSYTGTFDATLQAPNQRWMFKSVSLTGGTTYKLSFFARRSGTTSAMTIQAKFGTTASNAGMTTSIISSVTLTSGFYQYLQGTLTPSTSGTYYIGILGANTVTSQYISVDDISLDVTGTPLTGTKTIKTIGGDYSSFTSAILDLNAQGVGTDGITFNIDAGSTFTEDCPAIMATGTSANQIIFQKSGTGNNPILKPTGGYSSFDAGIRIRGGDYFTFDGIDITINSGYLVDFGFYLTNYTGTDGAQYNTIKNSKITLNKLNYYSYGICQKVSEIPTSANGANSYNKYYNIIVENSHGGINLYGYTVTNFDDGCEIGITGGGSTIIGASTANNIGNDAYETQGIRSYYQKNLSIFKTEIRNVTGTSTTASVNAYGMKLEFCQGISNIYNNKVHDINITSTVATVLAYGIYADASASQTLNIYNNVIYSILHGATAVPAVGASMSIAGMSVNSLATATGTANVYFNSVNIVENQYPSSSAFMAGYGTFNIKNNIFANGSTAGGTSLRFCVNMTSATISSSSNNILYIATGTNNYVAKVSATNYASLQLYAAAKSGTAPTDGIEGGSANFLPSFTSATDLTLKTSSPARSSGTPITGITTDFTEATRDVTRPNIGAYETAVTQLDKSAPVLSNVVITGSATTTPSVSVDLFDNSASASNATVRLWYRLSTSAGAYTGIDANAKPSGSMNGTYTWNTSLTGLPKGTYNFYISTRDGQGVGAGIWVNPIWTTSFAGFSASDPPNYTANPDLNANVRSFQKLNTLAGGTYNVGNSQTLKKLTDVANELNNVSLTGDVIYELNSDYDGTTGETFPITFNQIVTSGGNWTVTIRPKSGAGARTTTCTTIDNPIILNGADNITFDGREGGTGSTIAWNLINSYGTNGYVFTLINDACNNNIIYCKIQGTAGCVYLGNVTSGITGNDNNSISYCKIGGLAGATYPVFGIYSGGTSGKENSNNFITNNEFFDIRRSSSQAISLQSNSIGFTITDNHIYQTSAYAGVVGTTYGMFIAGSGNGHIITGNYIGGTDINCGGTPWTINGTAAAFRFVGIYLTVGTTISTVIQNNTIKNYDWLSTSGVNSIPGVWAGIYLNSGSADISNNAIGASTGTSSVKTTITTTGGLSSGIASYAGSGSSVVISNNIVGAIEVLGNAVGISHSFTGIWNVGGTTSLTINNNTIGSTITANSIISSNAATGTTAAVISGIVNSGAATSISITNNTIANINSAYVPTAANTSTIVRGIISSAGINTITGNTISNLSTAANATGTTSTASIIGLSMTSTTAGTNLSQNTIYGLRNTNSSAAVCVTGIHYGGATTGSNTLSRNLIYDLLIYSISPTADMRGINFASGLAIVHNNMIRLGIDNSGMKNLALPGIQITGLYDVTSSANTGMYFNTVYIGGSGVGTESGNTYAFRSSQTTNIRNYKNNIFVNNRSNATTGGKHYCVMVSGIGINPTGLSLDYNIYHSIGTGAVFGYYGADVADISAWRIATGQDKSSGFGDPNFKGALGLEPNLHIQSPTPIEASGTPVESITNDFDGDIRAELTPVDIGADAGDFTVSDICPPAIAYTNANNGTIANKLLLNFATITDNVGVSSGANAPRFYYKKSTDNDAFVGNTSSDNGWKYVVGTGSSPYSFTIDYSIINGGSVVVGDIIQYFVVAQDDANNLGSYPLGATYSSNPPIQNINGKATTPNTYNIVKAFKDNINVGSGEIYTSLTKSDGLFAAINGGFVTGNLTINVTSDLDEDGAVNFNQQSEEGIGGYTVTIKPDGTTLRTISSTTTASGIPMININGTDRITIDGGSGKYLTFRNTNANAANTGATIQFTNKALACTLTNCTIENNSSAKGSIIIAVASDTGRSTITISNNDIRDAVLGTAGSPKYGIFSNTSPVMVNPNILTITNNNFYNFTSSGVYLIYIKNGSTISGNSFYNNMATAPTATQQIIVAFGDSISIIGNYLGGQAPNCGGSAYVNNGAIVYGMNIADGTTNGNSIQGNTVQNFNLIYTGSTAFRGIYHQNGKCYIGNITGNLIGSTTNTTSITIPNASSSTVYGIMSDVSGTVTIINNNTIAGIYSNLTTTSVTGIYFCGSPTREVCRNKIYNISTGGSIHGISERGIVGTTKYTVANNQILLGNGLTNNATIYGIYSLADTGNTLYKYYNTIVISGTGTGASNSYVYYKSKFGEDTLINNIFFNERTNSSTGKNYFIATYYSLNNTFMRFGSDYNLLVSSDLNTIALDSVTNKTFDEWKTTTGGDINSYNDISTSLLSADLFNDKTAGNLNINNNHIACWHVKGKGAQISTISDDYGETGVRSTTIPGGTTCIGSDEFTTSTTPPSALQTGEIGIGNTNTFSLNGRHLGSIIWTAGTSLPTGIIFKYYSGITPPGVSNGKYGNGYWSINQTGGTNYTYTLILKYHLPMLGTISAEPKIKIAKRTGGVWANHSSTVVNQIDKTVTIEGLNSFSEFALTDSDDPLPVVLKSLSASVNKRDVILKWKTVTELNVNGFEVERGESSKENAIVRKWDKLGLIQGAGNSNSVKEYSFLDNNLNSGSYIYRLKMIDNDGSYKYSDEIKISVDKPSITDLKQNYPNSFNPTTKIEYQLSNVGKVKLELYNTTGQLISILVDEEANAGYYFYYLDMNRVNNGLATGLYIYRMIVTDKINNETKSFVKKMMFMK